MILIKLSKKNFEVWLLWSENGALIFDQSERGQTQKQFPFKGTPLFFDHFWISKTVRPIELKFLPQIEHLKWWDTCSRKKFSKAVFMVFLWKTLVFHRFSPCHGQPLSNFVRLGWKFFWGYLRLYLRGSFELFQKSHFLFFIKKIRKGFC